MNDPFVTFDTLTIGTEYEGSVGSSGSTLNDRPELPSILARLPRVPIAPPRPSVQQRFDEAEPTIPTAHLVEQAGPTSDIPPGPTLQGDPTQTIRFDTVGAYPLAAEQSAATVTPSTGIETSREASPITPFQPATVELEEHLEDPWSAWLLNLEATIQPYSRWIALAAVIAALGLTIVLLRSGGGGIDAPGAIPQVSTGTENSALAASTDADAETEAEPWLTPQPAATPAEPAAVAVGPISAPRPAGHAMLTGELLPTETPRVADSSSIDTYNRTTR